MPDLLERLRAALADRYAVESEVGRGGMATVFLAEDLKHHRKVAIKVLHPELGAAVGPDRFLREIETVAGLTHPHVLPLYDSGDADGLLYYVMPYVEGESLALHLEREGHLSLPEALSIAGEVADGLDYAHERGIVHRDIKPGNILLSRGHALIADFGVAKAIGAAREGDAAATATGLSVGTPRYMSPEQAVGSSEIDGRCDVYALGCVLWEMLVGEPPFDSPTPHVILARKTTEEPPEIRLHRRNVSRALETLLVKAMAVSPVDRFQTAGEFARALKAPETVGRRRRTPQFRMRLPAILGSIVIMGSAILAYSNGWLRSRPLEIRASNMRPVTNSPGVEYQPAISPDGAEVAYVERHRVPRIVVRSTLNIGTAGDGRPGAEETGLHWLPSWTPDGASVRFLVCGEADSGVVFGASCGWREAGKFGGSTRAVAVPPRSVPDRWSTTRHAWSPDGMRLAFVIQDSIFATSGDSSGPKLLAVHPAQGGPPPFPHSLAWSPDGRRIAYVQGNALWRFGPNVAPSSIWILDTSEGEPVRVTDLEHLNVSPQWFPDSRHLLFVSDRDGSRGVYVVEVGPDGPRGLPRSVPSSSDPYSISLSTDGRRLAYSNLYAGGSNVWSIPIPETGMVSIRDRRAVTTGHQTIEAHGLSPDGEWIVFDSDRQGEMDIWKQRLDGGGGPQLVADVEGDAWEPDWSPDGTEIVFSTAGGLFVVPADGGAPERVTTRGGRPDWSPDGLAIAFGIDDDPTIGPNVWVVSRDSIGGPWGDPVQLTELGCWYPQWFPDGMSLLCGTHADPDAPGTEAAWARVSEKGEILSRIYPRSFGLLGAYYAQPSTDGSGIYACAHHEDGSQGIWWLTAQGGDARKVVALDDPGMRVNPLLSVGRTHLYVSIGEEAEGDIWVMDLEW
jgi:serine/threonine protein kinase/WD40 repeat protein